MDTSESRTHPYNYYKSGHFSLSQIITTFVYLTTSEMRTPHYSGHYMYLVQLCHKLINYVPRPNDYKIPSD